MYTLYHDKANKEIKVMKAKKAMQYIKYTEEVTSYNNCYFICLKRKPLVVKANEIKQKWISELEKELSLVKDIKI